MEQLIAVLDAYGSQLGFLLAFLVVFIFIVRSLVKLLAVGPGKKSRDSHSAVTGGALSRKDADILVAELEESLGIGRKPSLSDQEKIARLAKSDPERAKELVRHWLRQ